MSETGKNVHSNGVVRVGRKGRVKFAFGSEDDPRKLPEFEVDVVMAWQEWTCTDRQFREQICGDEYGDIPSAAIPQYYLQALEFVKKLAASPVDNEVPDITPAEALDFIARLREQYDEVAVFFRPRSREERDSPDISEVEHRFSEEPAT